MPGKRTTMRKLRDVLRLRHAAGLSIRDISRSTKLSVGGIQKLLSRAQALHLSWPLPAALDDTRLAQLFYPGADTGSSRLSRRGARPLLLRAPRAHQKTSGRAHHRQHHRVLPSRPAHRQPSTFLPQGAPYYRPGPHARVTPPSRRHPGALGGAGPGLAGSSPGIETAACDQTAVVGRIYPTLPEPVLQLLPVL